MIGSVLIGSVLLFVGLLGLLVLTRVVPFPKVQNGYGWRALRRTAFRRMSGMDGSTKAMRHLILFGATYLPFLVLVFVSPGVGVWGCAGVVLLIDALLVDDLLNGDDEQRKKRWDAVRNKIKWRMELPAPVPAGSRVGS